MKQDVEDLKVCAVSWILLREFNFCEKLFAHSMHLSFLLSPTKNLYDFHLNWVWSTQLDFKRPIMKKILTTFFKNTDILYRLKRFPENYFGSIRH